MAMFNFAFCNDDEKLSGKVEADSIVSAVISVLSENGRFEKHNIKEQRLLNAYSRLVDSEAEKGIKKIEFIEVSGYEANSFSLDVKSAGSRKRIPARMSA